MHTILTSHWLRGPRLVVGLAVVALIAWGVQARFLARPAAPEVITAPVERADLEDAVLASGTIKPEREVSVGAQVSGQVRRLHVALGDNVRQGQLIAEIDSTTQRNNLRNAEAQVALLQAQLQARQALFKQAEVTLRRRQELLATEAGSRADLDEAEATLATTRADIAALQAQIRQAGIAVDTARVNLGYTRITAPIDGVVTAVITEEGRTVNALQSAPTIIKLARLDRVLIKAQISEADVIRVKPGLPVYFTVLGEPNQRYEARLRTIEPAPESEQTESTTKATTTTASTAAAVYYNGLFEVPNPESKLRVAMTAQVFVVLAEVKGVLAVPAAALGSRDRKTGLHTVRVLAQRDGVPEVVSRTVKVGMNNRVQAEVLEGLKEGELVVVGDAAAPAQGTGQRRPPGLF